MAMGESALSLVARLVNRPVLFKNYSFFQEEGLRNKEVVQISGEGGSGKSLVLLDLIKACILPREYGGAEANIVLIDADCQFSVFQLVTMLKSSIIQMSGPETFHQSDNKRAMWKLVEASLERLSVFSCNDLESLFLRFHYLKTFLISNPNTSIVMIDNLSAFYWKETQVKKDLMKMECFLSHILSNFHNQLNSFNISLIYTLPKHFQSRNYSPSYCSEIFNLKCINTSIHLQLLAKENSTLYTAEIKKCNNIFSKSFKISKNGLILWF